MNDSFLGVGWKLPLDTAGGRIAVARYEESIQQAIWIVLATARGERKMRPDFGCGLHDLVFSGNGAEASGRAMTEVRRSLILWEPRIEVLDVTAGTDPEDPTCLLIEISYRVRATNNRFNLVYPFYLE
jgi:Bacteriophage baseplate protein W